MQERITQSRFSRTFSLLVYIIVGLAILVEAFILLFWSESQWLYATQSLNQVKHALITVENSPVKSKNNLKVVYLTGLATPKDPLRDGVLGLSENAIQLNRAVEMYQWRENVESHLEKQADGTEQEIKTYTYEPIWASTIINSTDFKDGVGHQNPRRMLFDSKQQHAHQVKVGSFILSPSLVGKITTVTPVDLSEINFTKLQKKYHKKMQYVDGGIYVGEILNHPQIGDMRVKISQVAAQEVSVIAQQVDKTLRPYTASGGQSIALLALGIQSPQSMLQQADTTNPKIIWTWRLLALFLIIVSLALLLNPFAILVEAVPFFSRLMRFGVWLVACSIGIVLWSVALLVAWHLVKPWVVLGIVIFAVIACIFLLPRNKLT